jgi:hypothetical protein
MVSMHITVFHDLMPSNVIYNTKFSDERVDRFRVGQYDAPKHRWLPTKLQDVTSQTVILDVQLYLSR